MILVFFPVVKIHTDRRLVCHTLLPWHFDLPDSLKVDLSDILLIVFLLLLRLSEMSDTRLSVTPDQRYSDLSLTSC